MTVDRRGLAVKDDASSWTGVAHAVGSDASNVFLGVG